MAFAAAALSVLGVASGQEIYQDNSALSGVQPSPVGCSSAAMPCVRIPYPIASELVKLDYVTASPVLVETALVAEPVEASTRARLVSPAGAATEDDGHSSSSNYWITYYSCPPYCGDPSGPLPLAEGQAACDPHYMGRRFLLNGAEYICNDTGGAVYGDHVDLFFWSDAAGRAYLTAYGTRGVLTWR